MGGNDEGPIARWSRRKTEARVADTVDGDAPEPSSLNLASLDNSLPAIVEADDGPADETELPPLTPIEELDADSDYTQFLAKGVPEALTRAALRKLWLSDPVFANLDGLNDYDENFNLIDKLITAADTNYKVGRGMMSQEEIDAEAEEQAAADGQGADADDAHSNQDQLDEEDVAEWDGDDGQNS